MSLNMYLGAASSQKNSMNSLCIEIIQSMEQVTASIKAFNGAILLQGKTYRTAKLYMTQTYLPLAQGIIYLCEELIRQNDRYINDFKSEVATTDVREQEIVEQIREIDRMIMKYEELNSVTPFFHSIIIVYQVMKKNLQDKLQRLYAYNTKSANNYETALQLAKGVIDGLQAVQDGKGFNSKTGTFSTEGMNLDWVAHIDKTHYTRKAKEEYGDYLEEYPENIEKVITIIKYEESNPKYVDDTNEFLDPLETHDTIEIKYLIYSADEPYRRLSLQYLNQVEIAAIDESGVFSSDKNTIKFDVEDDRTNDRGKYFTFFHELGHAIDYYHGTEHGYDGFISESFEYEGKTLSEHMYVDVENKIQEQLRTELKQEDYDELTLAEKDELINNVSEYFIYNGPSNQVLSADEKDLFMEVKTQLSNELHPDHHNNASDVYGGVTVNQIKGKWAHHEESYWIDEETGERVREPNKEGFASYYGTIMLEEGDHRNDQLQSHKDYLPTSTEHMDAMFESMEGERS